MTDRSQTPGVRQKVQSAQVGAEVLKALGRLGQSAPLSQVAGAAGMPSAKAYRYLQALVASGFAAQDPVTTHYRLGFEALHLGLSALRQIDVVDAAAESMLELNAMEGHTCSLAVWANHGATVVKVVESPTADSLVTRLGAVLPILTSAAGLVFAAYLPEKETAGLMKAALAGLDKGRAPGFDAASVKARLEEVRRTGLGIVRGLNFPGVDAISAPVFDAAGRPAAALNILGVSAHFDVALNGEPAAAVRGAAAKISARIGYRAA